MILIDNLKKVRQNNNIIKINQNYKNYKFILFCDNISFKNNLNKNLILQNSKVKYIFLKRYKNIFKSLKLKNSIVLLCTNDLNTLNFLLSKLQSDILFCKIDNNIYSLKNLNDYINSKFLLINYLNNYFINFIYLFENIHNKK